MKRILCMFLACVFLVGLGACASADGDLKSAVANVDLQIPEYSAAEKTVLDRAALAETTDVVTLTEKGIEVKTEEGLCISYTYPNEDVVALSQDLMQQSLLYLLFYSENMSKAASQFVEQGMHLNIYDSRNDQDVYLYTSVSPLSGLVPDLNALSENDVLVIQNALKENSFSDAKSVTTGTIGDNLWILADYDGGGMMVTFVNGVQVVCEFFYADSTGPVAVLNLLENLSITAV